MRWPGMGSSGRDANGLESAPYRPWRRSRLSAVLCWDSPRRSAAQPTGQPSSGFLGSVPTGEPTGTTLPLSLRDTFDRALQYNLGLLESDQDVRPRGPRGCTA